MIGIIDILYDASSRQAEITRRFAAQYLDRATVEGYYIMSMDLWPELVYREKREEIKTWAADFIEYARYRLGETETCSHDSKAKATQFLAMCRAYGSCLLSLPLMDTGLDLNRFRGRTACAVRSMN